MITLPRILGDNMVLQRGIHAPVWGWAAEGEKVTVRFAGQEKTAVAGPDGKWLIRLDPMMASAEPGDLVIEAERSDAVGHSLSRTRIRNVLVGDVWLCSGQSNMVFVLKSATEADEARTADTITMRLFTANVSFADEPQRDLALPDSWAECTPQSAGDYSAVAFFFGRRLYRSLGVPVGLVVAAMGGSRIEGWMPREALMGVSCGRRFVEAVEGAPDLVDEVKKYWLIGGEQHMPSRLYNAMIAPIAPFGLRGVCWYQGESNAFQPARSERFGDRHGAYEYRELLPAMIAAWRSAFGQDDLPFVYLQLPNYCEPSEMGRTDVEPSWAILRESQLECLRVSNTAMAIGLDLGDPNDGHPRAKQAVGERLGLAALGRVYEMESVYSGPTYEAMRVDGNHIRIMFRHTGSGLVAKCGRLGGFEIAGEDGRFARADAVIDGETVVAASGEVAKPVAVRYAWANDPPCTLYNREGLPASPFRTKQ